MYFANFARILQGENLKALQLRQYGKLLLYTSIKCNLKVWQNHLRLKTKIIKGGHFKVFYSIWLYVYTVVLMFASFPNHAGYMPLLHPI